jgi:hypothetical protein
MAGLDPAIHEFFKTWMPGTSPGMTEKKENRRENLAEI